MLKKKSIYFTKQAWELHKRKNIKIISVQHVCNGKNCVIKYDEINI
jgi:hypothetical protein